MLLNDTSRWVSGATCWWSIRVQDNLSMVIFTAVPTVLIQHTIRQVTVKPLVSSNLPVYHARWASLSEGEAGRGVCSRFRIHGGRREGMRPACRGGVLSVGPQGLSPIRACGREREDMCQSVVFQCVSFYFHNNTTLVFPLIWSSHINVNFMFYLPFMYLFINLYIIVVYTQY